MRVSSAHRNIVGQLTLESDQIFIGGLSGEVRIDEAMVVETVDGSHRVTYDKTTERSLKRGVDFVGRDCAISVEIGIVGVQPEVLQIVRIQWVHEGFFVGSDRIVESGIVAT